MSKDMKDMLNIDLLKNAILDDVASSLKYETSVEEFGYVQSIADGIATVKGLSGAFLEEVIEFGEHNLIGIVRELRQFEVKVVLFNRFEEIKSGMKVKRTGKDFQVPVGPSIIGRVLDVFGSPIDGMGALKTDSTKVQVHGVNEGYDFFSIEVDAPRMIDRYPVCKPLTTGIIAIDSMIPVGLGQRELILGDRKSGKTSIAISTILNQKCRYEAGDPIYCFYVGIGQKMDSIVGIYEKLKTNDAMKYTTIIAAGAADSAHSQFIAPYVGCAMAEFFMKQGKDCLIIYDDLSKHAVAYREISRLLGRPAGRDAYPADSFYIHARLLERAAYLSREAGGGSITAMPVIETQESDMSGYIATNVISITDGQIFLDTREIFDKPAIDVGASVSRTGSAAQSRATKKVSRSMKSELSQYYTLVKFLQFTSGGLDKIQEKILKKGQQTKYLICQEEDERYSLEEEVVLIAGAHYGIFERVTDKKQVRSTKVKFIEKIKRNHPQILKEIKTSHDISDETLELVKKIAHKFGEIH